NTTEYKLRPNLHYRHFGIDEVRMHWLFFNVCNVLRELQVKVLLLELCACNMHEIAVGIFGSPFREILPGEFGTPDSIVMNRELFAECALSGAFRSDNRDFLNCCHSFAFFSNRYIPTTQVIEK